MNKVIITYDKMTQHKDSIELWLKDRGTGSARYGGKEGTISHWLNGEDWCYYNQWVVGDQYDMETSSTVFVFKREKDAVEFALRFS